jgi:hypothetical protein
MRKTVNLREHCRCQLRVPWSSRLASSAWAGRTETARTNTLKTNFNQQNQAKLFPHRYTSYSHHLRTGLGTLNHCHIWIVFFLYVFIFFQGKKKKNFTLLSWQGIIHFHFHIIFTEHFQNQTPLSYHIHRTLQNQTHSAYCYYIYQHKVFSLPLKTWAKFWAIYGPFLCTMIKRCKHKLWLSQAKAFMPPKPLGPRFSNVIFHKNHVIKYILFINWLSIQKKDVQ